MQAKPTRTQFVLHRDLESGVPYNIEPCAPNERAFPEWTRRINLQPTLCCMVEKGLLRRVRIEHRREQQFGGMRVTGISYPVYYKV